MGWDGVWWGGGVICGVVGGGRIGCGGLGVESCNTKKVTVDPVSRGNGAGGEGTSRYKFVP